MIADRRDVEIADSDPLRAIDIKEDAPGGLTLEHGRPAAKHDRLADPIVDVRAEGLDHRLQPCLVEYAALGLLVGLDDDLGLLAIKVIRTRRQDGRLDDDAVFKLEG